MAGLDDAARSENRPAKSVGDPLDVMCPDQLATHRSDLFANPFRPARDVHRPSLERHKLGSVAVTDSQLQLRPADFNAEKHGLNFQWCR